jgi:hypothetical protein
VIRDEFWDDSHPDLPQLEHEVDVLSDPLIRPPPHGATPPLEADQTVSPRRALSPDQDILRAGIRSVLGELEKKASEAPSAERARLDREWVETADQFILKETDFVAGGFGRHIAA